MKVMFLDESGDHNLTVIDPQYPLFALGGVIMDLEYAENTATERIREFKLEYFATENINLHTSDMARNRNGFEALKDRIFRERFYEGLNTLMNELEFEVVACVIKKLDHLRRYGMAAVDPYMLSLDILVERFCMGLEKEKSKGIIIAEKRGSTLDRQLEIAWLNLKVQGTRFIQANKIDSAIESLNLRDKKANLAGLEIADLIISPIGRMVVGKKIKEDFRIIQKKLRKSPSGKLDGYGLVILPKEKSQPPLRSDQPI